MENNLQNLGLAARAGKVIKGTDGVCAYMAKGKVYLCVCASDASSTTLKKMTNKASYYHVPLLTNYSTESLNKALGDANLKVVGITDKGFAKLIVDNLEDERN